MGNRLCKIRVDLDPHQNESDELHDLADIMGGGQKKKNINHRPRFSQRQELGTTDDRDPTSPKGHTGTAHRRTRMVYGYYKVQLSHVPPVTSGILF